LCEKCNLTRRKWYRIGQEADDPFLCIPILGVVVVVVALSALEDQVEDEEGQKETGKVTEGQKDHETLSHAVERHLDSLLLESLFRRKKIQLFSLLRR
jgi:hypothetical protein